MKAELQLESTHVPIDDGKDVRIEPGQPWPSAYRGSRYSLTEWQRGKLDTVMKWEYHDLKINLHPPDGLLNVMKTYGKSEGTGLGSFRITADGEVLTKIHADDYSNVDEAPVSRGWIPVYLGQLAGRLGFSNINIDPEPLKGNAIGVWDGLPFHHGERWAVGHGGNLIWKWRDYRFESAYDHNELISRYKEFRQPAGRLYINEYGHVYINVDTNDIPKSKERQVLDTFTDWRKRAENNGNDAGLNLVTRRLKVTSDTHDPQDGLLPMYIGNLRDFDDGVIPKPVVDDVSYYRACGQGEVTKG